MTLEILSIYNARVKQWASLLDRKNRDRTRLYMIEGVHLVQEALVYDVRIETLIFSLDKGLPAEIASRITKHIELIGVSETVLAKITDTVTPQGICAIVRMNDVTAERIVNHHRSLVIVIDGVQDPGNLGTIIRSADAVGASGILLGKGTVDLYNPKMFATSDSIV